MATIRYKIVRCPHCNKKLARRSLGTKRPGSPFHTCPKCGKEYLDSDYYEPAIEGIKPDTDYLGYLVLVPVFLIAGLVLRESRPAFFGFCVFFVIVFAFAGLIGLVKHQTGADKRECEQHLEASKSRLRDPAYALKLKLAGYNIPPEYDPTAQITSRPAAPKPSAQVAQRPASPKPSVQVAQQPAAPKKAKPNVVVQTQTDDEQEKYKYCRKCGTRILQHIAFCPNCGASQTGGD